MEHDENVETIVTERNVEEINFEVEKLKGEQKVQGEDLIKNPLKVMRMKL
jgi:hypothetical protein